jgi:hypothetical protein
MAEAELTAEREEQQVETIEQQPGETPPAAEVQPAEDEVVVTIGDETPPNDDEDHEGKPAPQWVKELRKSNREKDRKLREQEAEIAKLKGAANPQPAAVVVGDEPTLEGCDYDAEKFKAEWRAWTDRKAQADAQEREKAEAQRKQQETHQQRMAAYAESKAKLKVSDFEEAEATVIETLSQLQQSLILHGAKKNAAVLVYALGKNPAKAKELAAITDPVDFAWAAAQLETQLKVTPRKPATQPERVVRSSVAGAAAVDDQLEKLRQEAMKTGDLSKLVQYKNQQRNARR